MKRTESIKIFFLYFILIAGGTWHLLGWFQKIMTWLSGPLLIGLGIWLYAETARVLFEKNTASNKLSRFNSWVLVVVVVSFLVETAGVKTGIIFGAYAYGSVLMPQLWGVPLAIGFAWLVMILSAAALWQRLPYLSRWPVPLRVAGISALMTFFDFMMEPAAVRLGYWTWQGGQIPVQNYLAWFVLSAVFAGLGQWLGMWRKQLPRITVHAYFAQMIYFVLVIIK